MKVISCIHVSMKTSFDFPVLRISTEDELSQIICILFPFQYFLHILHAMSTVNSSNAFICNSWTDMNCGKTVWKKYRPYIPLHPVKHASVSTTESAGDNTS